MERERVLIVTGAGASRELAQDGQLPLMTHWAEDIVQRLNREQHGLAQAVGLEAGMGGEKFEKQLGRILAWGRSVPITAELSVLGEESILGDSLVVFPTWQNRAGVNMARINRCIYESLWQNFGDHAVSTFNAEKAYQTLFDLLGIEESRTALTVATTNYDFAAELALTQMGWRPFWGEEQPTRTTGGSPRVHVVGLARAVESYQTPVLHLHGRVGWYRRSDDGQLVALPPRPPFQEEIGQPGLLLPEPAKKYDEDPLFRVMWDEFEWAIGNANRVFVLGHSLNDDGLVKALTPAAENNRLRVTVCVEGLDAQQHADEIERIARLSGTTPPLPVTFGPAWEPDGEVRRVIELWRRERPHQS
jgi:hypothetical protein